MKILNFGSCNVDYVYSLDHITMPGETQNSNSLKLFPGGKGLNQAIAIARAGSNVHFAGCLGDGGEMLKDILSESSVDLSLVKTVTEKNGHAIISVSKDGENSIILYPGSNAMVTKDYVDEVLENFEKDDIILLQNEISNVDYIIEKAYKKGMCIIFNPSPFNDEIKKVDFSHISFLVLNEVEAKAVSSSDGVDEGIAYLQCTYPSLKIMLTLGSKGSVFIDGETKIYQDIFPVKAVDTTGAGDTFTGYFVSGISKGDDVSTVLKRSSVASGISVSRNGAATSIPCIAEVDKIIQNNK